MRNFRALLICSVAAALCGAFASAAPAETLQPHLLSVSGPVSGHFTYTYDLQLTSGNGLAADPSFPSSIVLLDFGTVTSASISHTASDITATTDWAAPSIDALGSSILPVWNGSTGETDLATFPGSLVLHGQGNFVADLDSANFSNVSLRYIGAGVPLLSAPASLIQLQIVSTQAPGPLLQSLSINTAPGVTGQSDSYPVATVPEPASLSVLLLGAGALLARRRRA